MSAPEILTRIQPIFCDIFDDPALKVSMDDSASTVDGWDSLSHIRLVSSIEKQFKVRFALGELQDAKNIGDMVNLIVEKLADRD
jgi:acyl carrier protein